ncbi:MAG: Gfo/Idh/MocA family protein [Planctomycetaceae bacterium]
MTHQLNRRDLLKTTAAAGVGFWFSTTPSVTQANSANEKLNIALIGIGGRGGDNLNGIAGEKQNIVALCDVDDQRAGDAYTKFPKAKKFYDYRVMFDEMEKEIDAVVVSTPDHTHFHPAMATMLRGKHLYCEKPMGHTVWETRQMTDLAAEKKIATQLGVQRHAYKGLREAVQIIWSGLIGDVSEVHTWVDGDRGLPPIPADMPPVPSTLKWDLWLGPVADRPYHPTICPYGWRFWWDFGTGETGNMGCHILDIPFWALDLKSPTRVDIVAGDVDELRPPTQMTTSFQFPKSDKRPAVTMHWYHTKIAPPIVAEKGMIADKMNNLFIGTKGMLLCGFDKWKLYPEKEFANFRAPDLTMPPSPGFYREWIDACKGGNPATCHFDYSGPLTETVLLGNVAYRSGGSFDWDSKNLKALGNDNAERFLKPQFRPGWEV